MLYAIPVYAKQSILTLVGRVEQLPVEKEYAIQISFQQIKIIGGLHEKLFDKARYLFSDLTGGGTISREKNGYLLISEDELETIASCVAVWQWMFPTEFASDTFNQVRFIIQDLGKRTIR
jgi:hypothetical protein